MKIIFRSKDFASIQGAGLGFNNRRPTASPWQYQGRVQHARWTGTYECHWDQAEDATNRSPTELIWTVQGDERLFGLAAALKSQGFPVEVEQDEK